MVSQQILGTERISKLLIKYSIPAIIGMLVNSLYNVVDRIFIGNIKGVGSLAITGLGVTMPIMTIILAFGMLIGIGTTATISLKLGEGKVEDAQKLIGNAMTLSVVVGIILTIIGLIFQDQILVLFGASDKTIFYAKEYINIILMGTVVNLLAFSLNHSIRGDGAPAISAGIMIVGCVTNIILDYVLIFIVGMGIKGAAIATVTSQALTAIITIYYYVSGKSNLKFEKKSLRLESRLVKSIFAIGMSSFAMQLAASLVQVVSNHALKSYGGDLAIGAMATVSSISMFFLMPVFGINQGAQPIVGFNYGAKKYDRVRKAFLGSLGAATFILTLGFFAVQLFPYSIVGIFNKDPELMAISVNGLRVYLFMLPIIGISIIGGVFIQSIGNAKMSMILSLLRQVILLIPFIIVLPRFMGLKGVWMAQPLSDLIAVVLTGFVVLKELKRQKQLMLDQTVFLED
ncbi:MAG: MATE family efflux transporter [Clostridioides difficile]|nr:MATE family efflux transporter [Clostridioides sp.]MBS5788272.1 MATE family efflux transporter [Clostridioides difficile]